MASSLNEQEYWSLSLHSADRTNLPNAIILHFLSVQKVSERQGELRNSLANLSDGVRTVSGSTHRDLVYLNRKV